MSAADDYAFGLYPDGSGVLRNKFGLRDGEDLHKAEYLITRRRENDAPDFPLTRAGYQDLHRHLLQEVFEWAGELRTVDMSKLGTQFASARHLSTTLDTVFVELAARNLLRGRTGERFADAAAHHISELNVAHPFREGNGRAMRLHLSQLAAQAGHTIDMSRIDGPAWIEASIRGYEGDEKPLANIIASAITPDRWLRPAAALAELSAAIEQARLDIVTETRAVAMLLRQPRTGNVLTDDIERLREDLGRLGEAAEIARPLRELTNTNVVMPIRAPHTAAAAERAHAILAAAERLPNGTEPAPTAAASTRPALDTVLAAIRGPAATEPGVGEPAPTPMAERLAKFEVRQAAKDAAKAATKSIANPDPTPDSSPTPKPSGGPEPSF